MKKSMIRFLANALLIVALLSVTACETVKQDDAAAFENSVFVGDSITEGFAFNGILPEESIIAGAGATAGFIYDDVDDLAAKKPEMVFIMLGSDDLLMPVDDPKELFRNDLTKLVNRIRELLPDCKIYLQSITPVTQEALAQQPRYARIGEYNELLRDLADELSIPYVDIGVLAEENPDLFAEDGVHFKEEFYQLWLEKLSKSL